MIPKRIHRDLPGDAQWIIGEKRRQLTVYLAAGVPEDSSLEQHFVRQATRAWRRRNYPGPLVIIPIAAAGVAWAARKMAHPLAATGVVAGGAMVALAAVTLTGPDEHHPPTVIGAPPAHSPSAPPHPKAPAPSQPPGTSPPPSPSPPTVTPGKPKKPHPTTGRGNSSGKPGRTPPGHGATPPGHGGTPPGKPPSGPPPDDPPEEPPLTDASNCGLAEIQIGHLVRICL